MGIFAFNQPKNSNDNQSFVQLAFKTLQNKQYLLGKGVANIDNFHINFTFVSVSIKKTI